MNQFKMNDPIWILGQVGGFFERYLDEKNPHVGARVGVTANAAGFGAVVPTHWITERDING